MSLTRDLAAILARPVDNATRSRAALHVLDWVGNAALGASSEVGRKICAFGRTGAAGPCYTLGAATRQPEMAAFVNGALGNIFEMDDIHRISIVHPGDVVVPAAMAFAGYNAVTGPTFLDAVVRGYEAAIRIGAAAGTGHYALWYNTATCGVFGAAAAVSDLRGLGTDVTIDALGHAGEQTAGLWQCRIESTDSKQVLAGRAAQSGVIAAELAACGLRGPAEILEGSHGFFTATAPGAQAAEVTADADGPWRIHDVSFKPWPACRHVHPAIEVALKMRDEIAPSVIAKIEVATYAQAIDFCDRTHPMTPHEGRFSLQFCTALALLRGAPSLGDFAPAAIADREVLALAAKVGLVEDPAMTGAFPVRYPARLTLHLDSGETRTREVATALGDPENPMNKESLVEKARTLINAAGHDTVDEVIAASGDLPSGGSARAILALLCDPR
ncbi:MAG: MmgE/PrpD family protein [Alphaproteobacteria bacterium]|nr:MmgE/PrpD family protein [Alphaproteobacteria bacterium]